MNQYDEKKDEKYIWLEEVEGKNALDYVRAENKITLEHFQKQPLFKDLQQDMRKIVFNKEKLPNIDLRNGKIVNFWQDEKNPKGVFRTTTIESYKSKSPQWEIIIDLDALSKKENENWVWKGTGDLLPTRERTLIYLSRGGKDASVIREYDWKKREFIKAGFNLPESKGGLEWIDRDSVLVSTDFGPGTMTHSGYPRQVRYWKRGEDYKKAPVLFEAEEKDMSIYSSVYRDQEGTHIFLIRQIDFYGSEIFNLKKDFSKIQVPLPKFVRLEKYHKGYLILNTQEDFKAFKAGSVLALPLKSLVEKGLKAVEDLELVFSPTDKMFSGWTLSSEDRLFLNITDDVMEKVEQVERDPVRGWVRTRLAPQLQGNVYLTSADQTGSSVVLTTTDFLVPPTQYLLDSAFKLHPLKAAPESFRAADLKYTRHAARSADGTLIPYFLVSKKDLQLNGKNPTVLYGYGGFQVTLAPTYRGIVGKAWLERGGVYVLANLRGGGEFGPKWHESVLKHNRYKVYEDFVAIAEDLIAKKITSPKNLGIMGGSNGGLLVGATMVKRPDLFNAVICEVPLLDMLRYQNLLAGASWMAEYGDPADPEMRQSILKYSPFQKVEPGVHYPQIFLMTSTKDDRVHPGHARKMAAKMKDQGHSIFYYENIDGGHGRTSNPEAEVLWNAMEWVYFWEKLGGAQ